MSKISAWSFSRLSDFEKCRYRAKLRYIDKIPEPPRSLPPGKTEHANDRGSRIHEAAELYIRGGVTLVPELLAYKEKFDELREWFAQGMVSVEGEWAFNRQWDCVAWKSADVWCRMKLDAMVMLSNTHARVIDFKTGKKFGNEIKHMEQGQLYQLATFLRYPELEHIEVEFWYTDQPIDTISRSKYTRDIGARYIDKFDKRGAAMTSEEDFPPNPNAFSCKWCPYLGNACEYGVSQEVISASDRFRGKHRKLA